MLVVGCSHLRSLADGIVPMPDGGVSFAFWSMPGACAAEIRAELGDKEKLAKITRTPDLVCLLAPGNNLTASRTVDEAKADFARLLATACRIWPKVGIFHYY